MLLEVLRNPQKGKKVCNQGEECEYHHPVICKNGINCGRKRCKFVHTKEMKEAITLKKLMKKTEEPKKFVSNMRTDKSYSETVKNYGNKTANNDGNKKSKKNTEKVKEKDEDFQDPKVIKILLR